MNDDTQRLRMSGSNPAGAYTPGQTCLGVGFFRSLGATSNGKDSDGIQIP